LLLALSNFLLNQAIANLPVSIALLIFYTYPLLLAIFGWVAGRDRPTLRVVGALLISLVGLALTLRVKGGPLDPIGLAYAFAASASWGSLMLVTGKMLGGRKTQVHTLYMMVCATVVFGIALLVTGGTSLPDTARGWVGFTAAPIFYFMAFVGTMTAVSVLGAVRTGFFSNFEAVGVIIFAALILEQYMTMTQLLGAALVIIAMFMFNAPAKPSKKD
jgi:drug/metabolite transporter (DMT)-like permease